MNIDKAKEIVEKAVKDASFVIGLDFIDIEYLPGNRFASDDVSSMFDRYVYIIKWNMAWLEKATKEEIMLNAYYQVRIGYQQAQVEFREKLIDEEIYVEEEELVKTWEEEFSYYTELTGNELDDMGYMNQETVIDAVSFAYIMYRDYHFKELNIPASIYDKVKARVELP